MNATKRLVTKIMPHLAISWVNIDCEISDWWTSQVSVACGQRDNSLLSLELALCILVALNSRLVFGIDVCEIFWVYSLQWFTFFYTCLATKTLRNQPSPNLGYLGATSFLWGILVWFDIKPTETHVSQSSKPVLPKGYTTSCIQPSCG